jgi:hypothetical protein
MGRDGVSRNVLESHDVVSRLHVRDALANRLNDTSALVPENNGEGTLGVLSGERVCIWTVWH